MSTSLHLRATALALVLAGAAGCSSSPKTAVYEHENFDDSGTFSRNYGVSDSASCEAARRALLSQGYILTGSDPKLITGNKSFQQTGESHLQISFSVVCAADGSADHRSTVFANALQDRYALKKVNNSASLGVGVLGSVSMPIGSTDDSMVKVASETVSSAKFYDRFFALVELFLPAQSKTPLAQGKPKAELGVPEQPPAKAPEPTPAVEAAPLVPKAGETTPIAPAASEPVTPPVEATPIAPMDAAPADSEVPAQAPAETPAETPAPAQPAASEPAQ